MAELKYQPVAHDHESFLKNARKRKGFRKAYRELEEEYALADFGMRIAEWKGQKKLPFASSPLPDKKQDQGTRHKESGARNQESGIK